MNMKDLVMPIGFALVTVFALNYFFPGSSTKQEKISSFVAPRERKEYRPLNLEIDFFDQGSTAASTTTEILRIVFNLTPLYVCWPGMQPSLIIQSSPRRRKAAMAGSNGCRFRASGYRVADRRLSTRHRLRQALPP